MSERALIVLVKVDDALRSVRSRHDRIANQGQGVAEMERTILQRRYDRLRYSNALFDEFHECQVMVSLFVNDTDLDRAFDEIFDIRRQIVDALQSDFAAPEDFGPECRMIYVGSYSEDDTVGLRQAKAVEQIKKKLRLFVRYEASEA